MIFVLVYFRALKRKPVICKSDKAFRFSRFLVSCRQRNHWKSFNCHGKYFAKENFRAAAWTWAKCYCRTKTGNPERAVSLHLARSGSQSLRRIWFISPARGACRIIKAVLTLNVLAEIPAMLNYGERLKHARAKQLATCLYSYHMPGGGE